MILFPGEKCKRDCDLQLSNKAQMNSILVRLQVLSIAGDIHQLLQLDLRLCKLTWILHVWT